MRDANNAYAIGADGAYLIFNGDYWVQQSVYFKQVFTSAFIFSNNFFKMKRKKECFFESVH